MSLITTIPVSDFLQSVDVLEAQTNLGCAAKAEILLPENNVNQNFTVLWDGSGAEIYDLSEIVDNQFQSSTKTGLSIGNSVTSIGSYAFEASSLSGDLVIGAGVTTIGSAAFYNCTGLTGDLLIPDGVTSIGDNAFYGCSGFTGDLVVPTTVTTTGTNMFQNCTNLTNVDCYVTKTLLDKTNNLLGTSVTTIHALTTDATWTAGAGQTIGGKTGIEVIKDLV